jgi:hypothetical protein
MTTISAKSDVVTLINVFTVEPANQRRLVELLTQATEVSVRRAPRFVSASLHRSTDGTKITCCNQSVVERHCAPEPELHRTMSQKIAEYRSIGAREGIIRNHRHDEPLFVLSMVA